MKVSASRSQRPAGRGTPGSDLIHKARHDIRSAMHVVIGMSKVLVTSDTLSPHQRDIVVTLKKNADYTMKLIDNMFDLLGVSPEPVRKYVPQKALEKEGIYDWEDLMRSSAEPAPAGKQMHALLVEDSAASVVIAGFFLKNLGYSYTVAKSGAEALEKFFKGHYDVIIMDIQLPDMDGLETARRIRALEKEKDMLPTPILAVTANATRDDQLFCIKAGMNNYLSKPFELNDLRQKLQNMLPTNSL